MSCLPCVMSQCEGQIMLGYSDNRSRWVLLYKFKNRMCLLALQRHLDNVFHSRLFNIKITLTVLPYSCLSHLQTALCCTISIL